MRRSLVLKKETLAELTTAELRGLAAGAQTPRCPTFDYDCRIPTDHCVSLLQCVSEVMAECVTQNASVCYC